MKSASKSLFVTASGVFLKSTISDKISGHIVCEKCILSVK